MGVFWDELGIPLVGTTVLLLALVAGAMWLDSASCVSQADKMGFDHSWGPLQACMIKVDGRWEPIDWQRSVRIKP